VHEFVSDRSLDHPFQEAEEEVELIKVQFVPLVQEIKDADAQNREYLVEKEQIKTKLRDFSMLRNGMQVGEVHLYRDGDH
jgi:hypothetical protein